MARVALSIVAAATLAAALAPTARAEDEPMSSDVSSSSEAAAPPADASGKPGADACIDENVKADLFAKRKQRTVRERLFQQTNRHELTARGGYYVSDLFDGTWTAGGAYTYHMTEDFGVEASAAYTRLTSSGGPELERTFAVLQGKPRSQWYFDADLVWVPAHAKMRLGGSITHFDLFLAAGGGLVDSALSEDLAGNGGFGLKFFLGHAWAIRIDVRDHVFRQQLLSQVMLVNDLTTTVGLSLYLPLSE
ncbi:MAG TPA: outer membrane beta-barrel domain-containing protein [Polyangia bacterium]|nr:outer membrane beta-barrel domain-containing protein [Polyangia bacterium]